MLWAVASYISPIGGSGKQPTYAARIDLPELECIARVRGWEDHKETVYTFGTVYVLENRDSVRFTSMQGTRCQHKIGTNRLYGPGVVFVREMGMCDAQDKVQDPGMSMSIIIVCFNSILV